MTAHLERPYLRTSLSGKSYHATNNVLLVRRHTQGAGTPLAVRSCALGGIAVEARKASIAVPAARVVFAVLSTRGKGQIPS